jgi:hypothetical protein
VPLSEVSWLISILARSGVLVEELAKASAQKTETTDEHGNRVISFVASSSVNLRSEVG